MIRRFKSIKILIILLFLVIVPSLTFVVYGASLPSPTSSFYVNDFAGVLSSDTEQYIIRAATTLESRTTAQVVVVTTSDIGDGTIEDFAFELFNKWGIGKKGEDNGILIVLDLTNRQSRIEVGYGLEGALPDLLTARIQDEYMIPYFRQDDFNQSVRQGFNAVIAEIYKEYEIDISTDSEIEAPVVAEESSIPPIVFVIGAVVVGILIFLDFRFSGGLLTFAILRGISRGGGGGGGRKGGGGGRSGGGGSTRKW